MEISILYWVLGIIGFFVFQYVTFMYATVKWLKNDAAWILHNLEMFIAGVTHYKIVHIIISLALIAIWELFAIALLIYLKLSKDA